MGRPVVHWELSGDVEAESAGGERVAKCQSSRWSATLRCHPERGLHYPVIPSERSESRDPPKYENVPCSILSGDFRGSFDSAAGRPRSG
jgi:hypothetical protein